MVVDIKSNVPNNEMRLELFLSDYCNYKCWYCSPDFNSKTVHWPEVNTILPNFISLLDYYSSQGKDKFTIFIGGGEPTLWPGLIDFVKGIKEKHNCTVSIHSNCSRTLRWWEENAKYFDHIGMSVHHEDADGEHLAKVGDIIYKNKVALYASVLMDPSHWHKCVALIETLKRSKQKWLVTGLQILHPNVKYTQEQTKYLEKRVHRHSSPLHSWFVQKRKEPKTYKPTITYNSGKTNTVDTHWLLLNGYNNFKGWNCNVGIETAFIDKKGNIRGSCGNTLYNQDNFYNIYDKDFKSNFKPKLVSVECKQTSCICQPETNCTKRKLI
jgi:MoaA/NifB/PqqE/SkfB family radical SAM enzyme